jgi:hypothetical protein
MSKWKYCLCSEMDLEYETVHLTLDALGQYGWELCCRVETFHREQNRTTGPWLVFKRPADIKGLPTRRDGGYPWALSVAFRDLPER